MAKRRTFGAIIVAALVGFVAVLLVNPKKAKTEKKVEQREKSDLFI